MTRIKYHSQYGLLWTEWITIGPNLVIRGVIDTENFRYEVRQFDTTLVFEGRGRNLRHCKDLVRKSLVEAGVNFDGEIRNKTK